MLLLLVYLALLLESASRIMLAQLVRQCPNTSKPPAREGYAQLNGTWKMWSNPPTAVYMYVYGCSEDSDTSLIESSRSQDRTYNRFSESILKYSMFLKLAFIRVPNNIHPSKADGSFKILITKSLHHAICWTFKTMHIVKSHCSLTIAMKQLGK